MASVLSTVNKVCDVVPELLIGVAIDVIVRGEDSFLSSVFGVSDRFDQLVVLAVLNVGAWLLESLTDYLAHVLWRGLAQAIQHDFRLAAYRHVQQLEVGVVRGHDERWPARRAQRRRQPARAIPRSRPRRHPPDVLERRPRRRRVPADVAEAVGARLPPDPADRRRLDPLPAPPRAALRRGARACRRPLLAAVGEPRRDHHDQGVHRRGARGGAAGGGVAGVRRRQPRGDPLLVGVHPADPAGDPRRVHVHARRRRQDGHRRQSRGRDLLGARLHDPAPAVAADRARRDARPVPAFDGLDPPHHRSARDPSGPRTRRGRAVTADRRRHRAA